MPRPHETPAVRFGRDGFGDGCCRLRIGHERHQPGHRREFRSSRRGLRAHARRSVSRHGQDTGSGHHQARFQAGPRLVPHAGLRGWQGGPEFALRDGDHGQHDPGWGHRNDGRLLHRREQPLRRPGHGSAHAARGRASPGARARARRRADLSFCCSAVGSGSSLRWIRVSCSRHTGQRCDPELGTRRSRGGKTNPAVDGATKIPHT